MAGGKEPIEVRFRLFDGTDIGPSKYDPSTTVSALKEFILARWPQDKDIAPKTVNDLKLINAGRILENNRTLAESRVPVGEVPGSVITMHVVVRPPQADKNSGIADNFSLFFHIAFLRSNLPTPLSRPDVDASYCDKMPS
ncbi:hypothetical protein EJB05_50443 [Eragrostis curvula]|uniref:Ubiquitin-like domain-containing protein n=1 Tax=Eragrostis curvula TaxID=38414 RepID=A0A5J9SZP6_9POAL|nr:hypothetical protein EJB05_50443 [Eragrostis curvula]